MNNLQKISVGLSFAEAAALFEAFAIATVSIDRFSDSVRRLVLAPELERQWKEAHPGRRLPGGNTNARLRKKRADALRRWWFDE